MRRMAGMLLTSIFTFLSFDTVNVNASKAADKPLSEQLTTIDDAQQVILVTASRLNTIRCKIVCYEKDADGWSEVYTMAGVIGKNGLSANRHEGDNTTPIGKFTLGTAFGKYKNPGTLMPYQVTTPNDVWSYDASTYNTWVTDPTIPGEFLLRKDHVYDYAFAINFNIPERELGKGSAIFFHIWRGSAIGTAGCVATGKKGVLKILKWLNPEKNPVIIIGREQNRLLDADNPEKDQINHHEVL